MKRGLALALLTLATSVVVSAQIHGPGSSVSSMGRGGSAPRLPASINSPGVPGFAGTAHSGMGFGHHPPFISGFRHRQFHRHFFPAVVGPYYWPYYGWGYPFDDYNLNAYQQPSQPVVVVVDPKSSDDRYGDHTFNESYSSPQQQAQTQAPPAPAQEQEPTVLVFRDGHQQEIRNYAIVGQMLWDFAAKGTRKIPLSDLDLDSTRKLNDERGVDFLLPKS